MKFSEIRLRETLRQDGGWVTCDETSPIPGTKLKVRAEQSRAFAKVFAELEAKGSDEQKKDPDWSREVYRQAIADGGLIDWSGEDYGECTPDAKREMMTLDTFAEGVLWAMNRVRDQGKASLEADEKN